MPGILNKIMGTLSDQAGKYCMQNNAMPDGRGVALIKSLSNHNTDGEKERSSYFYFNRETWKGMATIDMVSFNKAGKDLPLAEAFRQIRSGEIPSKKATE